MNLLNNSYQIISTLLNMHRYLKSSQEINDHFASKCIRILQ